MRPAALRTAAEGASYTKAPAGEDTDWRARALCRDYDPEMFYPHGISLQKKSADAKAVCHRCPVEAACREWALSRGELFGVWGGLDEIERETLRTGHRRYYPRTA